MPPRPDPREAPHRDASLSYRPTDGLIAVDGNQQIQPWRERLAATRRGVTEILLRLAAPGEES